MFKKRGNKSDINLSGLSKEKQERKEGRGMGFGKQMVKMMVGSQSAEDLAKMAKDILPEIVEKMGPDGLAQLAEEMIPQVEAKIGRDGVVRLLEKIVPGLIANMDTEKMQDVMLNVMPMMIDTCCSRMDGEQRTFMFAQARNILDSMEEKYKGA